MRWFRRTRETKPPERPRPKAPRDSGALLAAEHLHVRFGQHHVLRDITLEIPRGQTIAVIGESGCGKTVLLKTLIALVRPSQGEVRFDGVNLAECGERELSQLRTRYGFVFQGAALFDSLTVGQNVAFPMREHTRTPATEVRKKVRSLLAEVGLGETVIPKKPAELSGGMRKRVGLARALALHPDVMLYDEPTTGLDPIMSDVINELIVRTRERFPVTSIVVTHDMRTARKVADRLIMLYPLTRLRPDEPQIVYDGPAARVDEAKDPRVTQFVEGKAEERLMELAGKEAD